MAFLGVCVAATAGTRKITVRIQTANLDEFRRVAELAKELGDERAVLCICHMDKEYSQGFRHIRYDRNSAVSEGAGACEYRLRFDPDKP